MIRIDNFKLPLHTLSWATRIQIPLYHYRWVTSYLLIFTVMFTVDTYFENLLSDHKYGTCIGGFVSWCMILRFVGLLYWLNEFLHVANGLFYQTTDNYYIITNDHIEYGVKNKWAFRTSWRNIDAVKETAELYVLELNNCQQLFIPKQKLIEKSLLNEFRSLLQEKKLISTKI